MNKSRQYFILVLLAFFASNLLFAQTGSSLSFDGTSNSYATVPNNSALEFTTGTVEFWVNPDNYLGAAGLVALRDGPNSGTRFSLHLDVDNNVIGMYNGTDYRTIASPLSTGSWAHLAFVFKSTTTDIYINGSLAGSLDRTLNTSASGQTLTIGQNGENWEYFKGQIDELRIWNDERTAAEISSSYQLQLGGFEENLVAYYNFDEGTGTTSSNLVANGVGSATLQSGAAWGTNSTGLSAVLAKAVSFDGTSGKITVPNNSALETNDQTIEFWVKPDYTSETFNPGLIGMRDGSGLRYSIHMGNNRDFIGVWNGTDFFIASYSFTQGTWYHVAVVMNSSTTQFYVNGYLIGSSNYTHSSVTGKDLTIGQSGVGEELNGEMDEIRIWNDVRTAQEISANYRKELTGSQSGLVAYYRLNEGSGTTTRNWVQNGVGDGTLATGTAWTDYNWQYFGPSGSGTSGDPYLIANLDDLQWVSQNNSSWGSYFQQTADIDASATSTWVNGAGFSPIGIQDAVNFSGVYDGDGHTITGLTINRSSEHNIALFGYTNGAQIKNLGLYNVNINGTQGVGGIAGIANYSSIITNCFTTGLVTCNSNISFGYNLSYAGGIAGLVYSSSINNCYSKISINGTSGNAGGLAGYLGSGTK